MPRPPLTLETWGAINVKKLAPGKYEARARYRDVDGVTRPIQRTGRTKTAAEDALKQAMRDRLGPISGEEITRETRISTVADMWWQEFRDAKVHPNGTIRRYSSVLTTHVVAGIGEWRLQECTVGKLDRFIKTKAKHSGYSTASICTVLLSGMLDMAARHDAIDTNPMRSVAPVPKPASEIGVFSIEDVAELRAILADWDAGKDNSGRARVSDLADPVDMFLATGARPGEIFAIDWRHIDFTTSPPTLTLQDTMAKDAAGRWVIQHGRKSRKQIRLKLPPFAVTMLMRRRVQSVSSLVFPSSTGTPRIPDNFRTQWHAALRGTRFEGRVPKEFRSTVATFVRDHDGIEQAQHQLGHASLLTTEQHYAVPVMDAPDLTALLEQFNVKAESKR